MHDSVALQLVAEDDLPLATAMARRRGVGRRDGAHRDGVWYSMLRTDHPG